MRVGLSVFVVMAVTFVVVVVVVVMVMRLGAQRFDPGGGVDAAFAVRQHVRHEVLQPEAGNDHCPAPAQNFHLLNGKCVIMNAGDRLRDHAFDAQAGPLRHSAGKLPDGIGRRRDAGLVHRGGGLCAAGKHQRQKQRQRQNSSVHEMCSLILTLFYYTEAVKRLLPIKR